MTDPIKCAEEYKQLWHNNPLDDAEREALKAAIAAIRALNESVFSGMENLFLEPCEMFLNELIEGDRND